MTENVTFTPEQFEKLLAKVGGGVASAAGLGASPSKKHLGLGCGDGGMGPLASGVYAMLAAGSPRLALAKALGVPLVPYLINVRATFPTVDTADVPGSGSDVKITQDTLIDAMVCRVQSGVTAQNSFSTMSDFFLNFQSGIDATLDVQGAPRYSVAPEFTPISTLADMITGESHWPGGWILTYQQQLLMAFHANVTLPVAPLDVICTFRAWVPVNDMFVQMTNREAFAKLAECGISCDSGYVQRTPPK